MPTYDYACDACEHAFEHFQGMSDPVLKKCPECGKLKLRRLIGTGGGLIFKGSGFYITDYRNESYKSDAKKDSESKPSSKDTKSKSDSSKKSTAKTKTKSKKAE